MSLRRDGAPRSADRSEARTVSVSEVRNTGLANKGAPEYI